MPRIKAAAWMLSLATLSVPAFAQGTGQAVRDNSITALNFVQGHVSLDGQAVSTDPSGPPRTLHAGDTLATADGSADIMLAPGSLLRLGQGTQATLLSTNGNRAEVRIDGGRANVAVNAVRPQGLLLVDMPHGQTQILDRGLYTFDTATATVRVFNGKAEVFPGQDTESRVKPLKVKEQHEVVLGDGRPKPTEFDRMASEADLLPWTGPQEARADGDYGVQANNMTGNAGSEFSSVAYGPGPLAFGDGYGYPGYGVGFGWGFPYGFYGYPYGFYGYPGFGLTYYHGPYGIGHGYGHPYGYAARGGAGRGFSSGGGFAGGGFHGGGGGRR